MDKEDERTKRLWGKGEIRVFISHKAEDKILAKEIQKSFGVFGVATFVAHEDIEPMLEWQIEIVRALFSADLLVALLTAKFNESNWTDQEIGVAIGRRIPVIPMRIGKDPYGFIGKYQAIRETSASKIVEKTLDYLVRHEEIKPRLKQLAEQAFASAIADDSSIDRANVLTRVSAEIDRSPAEVAKALRTAFTNENGRFDIENIFDTFIWKDGVTDRLKDLAKDAFISEVMDADSFARANYLAGYLRAIDTLSIPQAKCLMEVFNENQQVRFAYEFAPVIAEQLSRMTGNNFVMEYPNEQGSELIKLSF